MPAMPPVLSNPPAGKGDKAAFVAPSKDPRPPRPPTTAAETLAAAVARAETPPLPATPIEPVAPPVAIPLPRPRPADHVEPASGLVTPAAMSFASSAAYADGAYTGPAVDAYYGYVQVQAIIQGGQLARIKVLQYPSDRRTSVFINRQALPMLRDEVVSAQTADVDIISGATLTSEAFIRSLDAALRKAGS
jgi:uncharacterized protein with FMN-binding domain